jgi:hypothetical protein
MSASTSNSRLVDVLASWHQISINTSITKTPEPGLLPIIIRLIPVSIVADWLVEYCSADGQEATGHGRYGIVPGLLQPHGNEIAVSQRADVLQEMQKLAHATA